jgi:hypothetical protein
MTSRAELHTGDESGCQHCEWRRHGRALEKFDVCFRSSGLFDCIGKMTDNLIRVSCGRLNRAFRKVQGIVGPSAFAWCAIFHGELRSVPRQHPRTDFVADNLGSELGRHGYRVETVMSDAVEYLHAYAIRAICTARRMPFGRSKRLQGAVGRIYLPLTKEPALAPNVDYLDDFHAARQVEKSNASLPESSSASPATVKTSPT